MPYASLRDFIDRLEAGGRLKRVAAPVSPYLEMTEIQTRLLAEGGPAVLFENVIHDRQGRSTAMPVLVNLFGTVERVAWGMDREPHQLREIDGGFLKRTASRRAAGASIDVSHCRLPCGPRLALMQPRTVSAAPGIIHLRGADITTSGLACRCNLLAVDRPRPARIFGHIPPDR